MTVYPRDFNPLPADSVYEKIETLDAGALGVVVLCRDRRNDDVVAIKAIKRTAVNRYIEGQIVNHSLLKHPHVVLFKECFVLPDFVCVVMEWATEGNLLSLVKQKGKLSEAEARGYFQQLVVGIDYVERKGLDNRDLKLENTLITVDDDDEKKFIVKLCDFGYSIHEVAERPKEEALMYIAPEVMEEGQYDDKLADVWAVGVSLYYMLFGHYPYELHASKDAKVKDEVKELHDMEKHHKVEYPEGVVSPECVALLQRLLEPEPSKRIPLKELLAHPWFTTELPDYEAHLNDMVKEEPVSAMPKRQSVQDIKQLLDFALA